VELVHPPVCSYNIQLSAAQPQQNDRGEINALFASSVLSPAALKGATSSPNGEIRTRLVAEQFDGKGY